ncbi:MAG TPA: peptidoglycan DD-metalloendopeptidase family protein [Gaiellaceae bacterium]|nr:peptidoglycan DD-metalloendopeptidase family protein [Gaiellaceae bacterium]
MSKPSVSVVIEPADGSAICYEPVAPKDASSRAAGVLCLELAITNNGSKSVHLTTVTLTFHGPPSVPTATIAVPSNWWPPNGHGVHIDPGATAVWCFARESFGNDTVVLPSPAPKSFDLALGFEGYSTPWTATKPLVPHKNPPAAGAYLFPAQFDDLRPGEFWATSSNSHGTGADGSQLFGYDMVVGAWDHDRGFYSRLLPKKDGTKNEHYRVWGKKIHAMADGTVAHFLDGVGANYHPGTGNDAGPWQEPPWDDPAKAWADHVGAGNHFYIRHGDEVVLYAHMQEGTLNKKLLENGATVTAGDVLGLAGNAGSASEPHLHIHAIRGAQAEDGPLRPLLFHDSFAVDPADLTPPSIAGPWRRMSGDGPPIVLRNDRGGTSAAGLWGALIWPLGRHPEWTGWEDLGGSLTSPPAVASWGPNRLDVFAAGQDGRLAHTWWDGSTWHDWQTLGGVFKGAPSAVSRHANHISVFVRGLDDHLGHLWWNGSSWQGWESLGGNLTSAPAASSWSPHREDVFAAGHDRQLAHTWWSDPGWSNWDRVGGEFKGNPAAVSWGPNRIDVFVRGLDDHLGHVWWT